MASCSDTNTKTEATNQEECSVETSETSISKTPLPFRRHRRNRPPVTREEIVKFRAEVLGIPPDSSADKETKDLDEEQDFTQLELAFSSASMSLGAGNSNSISPNTNPNSGAGLFTNFFENAASPTPGMASLPRQTPQTGPGQNGGTGGMAGSVPMNAGYPMDLNHVYEMVLELSEVLKNNRDMTKGIINSAEEIMKRATMPGASPTLQQVNGEITAGRVAELERALAKEKRLVEILKREQDENTKLIGEYETAVGTMVEQIRHYCQNNNMHYLAQKRHYNNLLQAERDTHLQSRLDRDYWHAQTMRCAEMIRTAYRLRCEEEDVPIRVIAGLQNEVRAYRNALGMEPEKPEEEYGWEILKDVPPGVD